MLLTSVRSHRGYIGTRVYGLGFRVWGLRVDGLQGLGLRRFGLKSSGFKEHSASLQAPSARISLLGLRL